MIYEVVIIKKPTKKEVEEGTASETLITDGVKIIVAPSENVAATKALRQFLPANTPDDDLDRIEVKIRPFG